MGDPIRPGKAATRNTIPRGSATPPAGVRTQDPAEATRTGVPYYEIEQSRLDRQTEPTAHLGAKPHGSSSAALATTVLPPQRHAQAPHPPEPMRPSQAPVATAILPPNVAFGAAPEPRSSGGRKKGDSRQPLEFAEAQQIGRFGLIREIARGGMGQVFLARDTKLGRKVAIKFLLHDDPNFVSRFVIEARATARCTHENIVTIFEVGEHQGLPFMVLEYLEGKTLSQLLEQKMSTRAFAELMVPVLRALERAHEHGIVHRDLKPSNIFVTDRGCVKVLDFGVAKAMEGTANISPELGKVSAPVAETRAMDAAEPEVTYVTFSGEGSLVGTLPYMSPEQFGADEVDQLSDIWAVGIMFWRALTGVHPAGTMKPIALRDKLCDFSQELPSIASRDPSLPRELTAIVDRCLAKRKANRYPSASSVIADLQAFLQPQGRTDDTSPYRGLAAFGENDAKFFFGRSNEIRTALGQLDAWPLLAVIGPSGVGKSSFVHAGLIPAIRSASTDWQVRVLRPGRSPLASLASASGEEDPQQLSELAANLREAPGLFGELVRREARTRRHRLLIVVDQLEELFTLSDDDNDRRAFLASLLAAADDPSAPVRIVLSMRADFLDRLAGHKQFLSELSRGLFFLSAPDVDNLRETLVRPAELAGYAFETTDIVEDMLQTASSRGALPLLQFAATRLWDARDRTRRMLTVAAYNAMGGVGGAFARHADEVAAAIPPQRQVLLRAVMSRLVTPEGTRAVVDHNELLGLSTEAGDVQQILDHLIRARLVLLHTDPAQGATVEIVHEVLISEWPTLRRWLEDSHALRGFMHELQTAARQWQTRGRPADLVWRGNTAQEALGLAKRHVLDLSATERDFLDAVRRQMGRARRRKVAAFTAIFLVLGLILAGGAVSWVMIQQKAKAAEVEATKARDAEAKVKAQLAQVQAAEARKAAAESEAEQKKKLADEAKAAEEQAKAAEQVAKAAEAQSREELIEALARAQRGEADARAATQRAEKSARDAAAALEVAKKATAEAKAATQRAERSAAEQRARAEKAEQNSKKISTDSLKD